MKWTINGSVFEKHKWTRNITIRLFGDEAEKLLIFFNFKFWKYSEHWRQLKAKKNLFCSICGKLSFCRQSKLNRQASQTAFLNVQIDKKPWYTDKKTFHSILIHLIEGKSLLFLKFVPRSEPEIQSDSILCRFSLFFILFHLNLLIFWTEKFHNN